MQITSVQFILVFQVCPEMFDGVNFNYDWISSLGWIVPLKMKNLLFQQYTFIIVRQWLWFSSISYSGPSSFFSLYALLLGNTISQLGVKYHSYADVSKTLFKNSGCLSKHRNTQIAALRVASNTDIYFICNFYEVTHFFITGIRPQFSKS